MRKVVCCSFFLYFAFIFAVLTKADIQPLTKLHPRALESFNPLIQLNPGICTYKVIITTSCSSPNYTTDQISIAFGDAFGNQVYDAMLSNPFSDTFKQCSTNTFQITGPCTVRICYIYFYRNGTDGWEPEIVGISGSFSDTATFYFNKTIPEDKWYGINECHNSPPTPPPPSSAFRLQIPGWNIMFLCMVLGIISSAILQSF